MYINDHETIVRKTDYDILKGTYIPRSTIESHDTLHVSTCKYKLFTSRTIHK